MAGDFTWFDYGLEVELNRLEPAQRVAFVFRVDKIASIPQGAHNTGVIQHRPVTKVYGWWLVESVDGQRIRRAGQVSEMTGDERFEARVD